MTDTYRSFLARRIYGNTPPEQPVARVASDAGRIAAAKIAYALSRSGNAVAPGPSRMVMNTPEGPGTEGALSPIAYNAQFNQAFNQAYNARRPVGPIQPEVNTGSPLMQLGGSSDTLMTVPSGGYEGLGVDPRIVAAAAQPGVLAPVEGPRSDTNLLDAITRAATAAGWVAGTPEPAIPIPGLPGGIAPGTVPYTPPPPYNVSGAPGENRAGTAQPQYAPASAEPLPNTGAPLTQLGGSSDTIMTVPSGGPNTLAVDPTVVAAASQPGALAPIDETTYGGPALLSDPAGWVKHAVKAAPGTGLSVAKKWLEIASIPQQWSTDKIGDQFYLLATSSELPDWVAAIPGGPRIWMDLKGMISESDQKAIEDAYAKGGGTGVWEDVIAAATDEMPWWLRYPIRGGTDFLVDPTGYLLAVMTGGGSVLGRGAIEAAASGDVLNAAVQQVASKVLGGPQKILDYTVDAPFNALGELIAAGIRRIPFSRTLLDETPQVKETEQINLVDAGLTQQDRVRREGVGLDTAVDEGYDLPPTEPPTNGTGPLPSPTGGAVAEPLPTVPDYRRYDMTNDGQHWIITDPSGMPVEKLPYSPPKSYDEEPNFRERTAQRRVNDLNKPLIRADDIALGSARESENAGLTWTSPGNERLTNRGRNLPPTIQTKVADDMTIPLENRQAWIDEWAPKAKVHEERMATIRKAETRDMQRTGVSGEQLVQTGTQILSPTKLYEMLRFEADDTLLPFREAFPGKTPAQRNWITGPVMNESSNYSLIEHAVFGTADNANTARQLLRMRQVPAEGFAKSKDFIDALKVMGNRVRGETPGAEITRGWRANERPPGSASKWTPEHIQGENPNLSQGAAAEEASFRNGKHRHGTDYRTDTPLARGGEPVGPPPDRPLTLKERGDRINSGQLKREVDAIAAQDPTAAAMLNAPPAETATITSKLPTNGTDPEVIRDLADPRTTTISPGNNRVEAKVPGEVRVRRPGEISTRTVTITRDPSGTGFRLRARAGARARPVPSLSEAIAVGDEILARSAKGIEPVDAQVQRVFDAMAPPAPTARTAPIAGETTTHLDNLRVDRSTYQNRKTAYSDQSVQNILDGYDKRLFHPIEVKANPDGTYTVLSGHSRHEAWKRLVAAGRESPEEVPIRILTGTDEELRRIAQTSNTRGTPNTFTEQGILLKRLIDEGMPRADALRQVNVNSADGTRLMNLTNLNPGLQDDIDAGRLSVRQGAILGDAVGRGVITPLEADQLFLTRIASEGITDANLKFIITGLERMKAASQISQGDLFGGMDLGGSGMRSTFDDIETLGKQAGELVKQEKQLTNAMNNPRVEEVARNSLQRTVDTLRAEVAALEERVGFSLRIVSPGTAKAINMEPSVQESILRQAGALEGPGQSAADLASAGDRSYIGAAHQMGNLDDETYLLLSRNVTYEGHVMRLWEAYDQALYWLDDPVKAKQRIAELGIDPELRAGREARQVAVQSRGAGKRSLYKALSAYDGTLRFLREAMQFNWARGGGSATADMVGNAQILTLNGEVEAAIRGLDPRTARHFINDERGKGMVVDNLPGMERHTKLTGGHPPPGVMQLSETRFETGHQGLVLEKLGPLYNLVRPIADRDIKAIRTGFDRNNRFSLYMASFDRNIVSSQNRFRGIVATRAKATGNDYTEWLRKLDTMGNDYDPSDVLAMFGDDRLARDWRELISQSKRDAADRVDQLLFSYKMTNADQKLKHVIFFHYWMSRALPLYAKTAFKNPWLLNMYANAWHRMEVEAEANGYPPNVRGFIQLSGSTSGFYGLLNPMQVLVPFSMLVDNNDDKGTYAFLRRWGLFINPLIEGAAASLGWTDSMPDLTGTLALRRSIRYTINYLNNNEILGVDGSSLVPNILGGKNTWQSSDIDNIQFNVINSINNFAQRAANGLAPGQQFVSDFEGSSRNAYEQDQMNSILINELEKNYGPYETWTPDSPVWSEYGDARDAIAMGRDGNLLADAVVEQMADAKMINAVENTIIPGGVYQRYGPRDVTLAEKKAGDQAAYDIRDLETTMNPDLTVGLQRLDKLGTENGRQGYKLWNAIVYGDPKDWQSLVIGDMVIDAYQLRAMTVDQRKLLADRWIAQYEGVPAELTSYRALRDDFLKANPEVGTFKEYQKGVGDYAGGTKAWREMYAKKDQAFGVAMGKRESYLRSQGKTGVVLDNELDQWAKSPEAYNVANGQQETLYTEPRTPKVPDYGFTTETTGGYKAGEKKDPMTVLGDHLKSYREKMDLALKQMQASGYSVTENDIVYGNPLQRQGLAAFGVPQIDSDITLYLQWASLNPGKTIDDYIVYLENLSQEAA